MLPYCNVVFMGVHVSIGVTDITMQSIVCCVKSYLKSGGLGEKVESFYITASELQTHHEF